MRAALISLFIFAGCAATSKQPSAHDVLPTDFRVSVGGAMGSGYAVELAGDRLRYTSSAGPHFRGTRSRTVTPSRDAWLAFWREAEAVEVWRWRERYEVPPPEVVYDGTQWNINMSFGNRTVTSSGDNAYPAEQDPRQVSAPVGEPSARFRRFCGAIRNLIGNLPFG